MDLGNIKNTIITNYNSIRFNITEPIGLRFARTKYEKDYKNDNLEPLISVYTPTYNRAELLMARAIESVLKQTYENFELIIVGDHCTDDTEKLVSHINDDRIRFYNIPKRGYRYPPTAENHWFAGPVVAANTALSMVQGKWIARIDDDDTWSTQHLEKLLQIAQKNNYEFVSSEHIEERYGERQIFKGLRPMDPYYTKKDTPDDCYNPLIGATSTWLYRSYLKFMKYNPHCWRKKWNKVNDIDLSLRIFHAGTRMGFLNEVHAFVLPRSGEETLGLDAYKIAEEKNYSVHN